MFDWCGLMSTIVFSPLANTFPMNHRTIYGQWNRLLLFKLDSHGSQLLEAQIKTATRNKQRTVCKTLLICL